MQTLELKLSNMHCDGCVRHVTRVLEQIPGVRIRAVTVGSAELDHDPAQAPREKIAGALADAGHPVQPGGISQA